MESLVGWAYKKKLGWGMFPVKGGSVALPECLAVYGDPLWSPLSGSPYDCWAELEIVLYWCSLYKIHIYMYTYIVCRYILNVSLSSINIYLLILYCYWCSYLPCVFPPVTKRNKANKTFTNAFIFIMTSSEVELNLGWMNSPGILCIYVKQTMKFL